MKIIEFPSVQRNQNNQLTNHSNEAPSLLMQYREGEQGEFLVWAICVVCAVASIVLCFSQLRNDVNRVQQVHPNRISVSELADETRWVPSKKM
jgi:hypothetical protein